MSRITTAGLVRAGVVFAALSALPFVFSSPSIAQQFFLTLMYAALASAWNVIGGYSGYISLGHAAFFGVGAYATAVTFTRYMSIGSGYRPFYVLPLVGLGVALASVPIAWVALRTRAATFAIVTVTLLFVVQQLAFNLRSLTGGSQGIAIPLPSFPTSITVSTYDRPFYFAMLGILALAVLCSWYVRGSRLGLALLSIRDDEDRARGFGVQTGFAKMVAFSLAAGLAAMVGGVWAYHLSFIYPQFAVDPLVTIGMVLMVYLGGRGTIWGPVLGAFILVPAQQELNDRFGAANLYLVAYAAVFLVVMLFMPRGILPSLEHLARRLRFRPTAEEVTAP